MIGKGMTGKGMTGKGVIGKGVIGKGVIGKGLMGHRPALPMAGVADSCSFEDGRNHPF
jgi:hypothetical protein